MPATPQHPSHGGPSSPTTTLTIILIITLPTLFLLAICYARRAPLFASIPGNRFHAVQELTRPSDPSGSAKLQPMPVVRYNKKLFAALRQDLESGALSAHRPDSGTNTSAEDLTAASSAPLPPFPIAQSWKCSLATKVTWLPLPAAWKEPRRRFPGLESTKLKLDGKQAAECCAICTEDFRPRAWVRRLPCKHIFHAQCIDPWLLEFSKTCPLCRIDLRVQQEMMAIAEPPRVAVGVQ
ncbi:hypothetical protein QBC39DRAFT_119652 [Podospora conica]|nr:hypothetical protein QBC39DRAFT_119652 [Schizothecium conicum]